VPGQTPILSDVIPPPLATAWPDVTLVGDDYVTAIRRIAQKSAEEKPANEEAHHSSSPTKAKEGKATDLPESDNCCVIMNIVPAPQSSDGDGCKQRLQGSKRSSKTVTPSIARILKKCNREC
jgi:hypothetical protein